MKKMLDVGCGPGTLTNFIYYQKFHNSYQIFGVDIDNKNIISIYKKWPNGTFQLANAENLPFKENFFDRVMSRHVLEHVKNIDKVIDEIYRVCKKGGTLYIAVPTDIFEKNIIRLIPGYMGKHHKRVFHINELENKLTNRGFAVRQRTNSKWPMFVMIILLAYISQFTRYVSMEMQTGTFNVLKSKEQRTIFSFTFLSKFVVIVLIYLDRFFWVLNNYIPWEMEITAVKK